VWYRVGSSMKREILIHKQHRDIGGCCPGHDEYPDETYKSNRSKRARSRDKQKEHQYVRTLHRRLDMHEVRQEDDTAR
jgi:hypothetical protein